MSVTIETIEQQNARLAEALGRGRYLITERLCLTRTGQLIPEDRCTDGGTLMYRIGEEIPIEDAQRYGLVPSVAVAAPESEVVNKTARKRK